MRKEQNGNNPSSLDQALNALEEDQNFLLDGGVFTSDLIETCIDYKRSNDLAAISLCPHPFEFNLYYDA